MSAIFDGYRPGRDGVNIPAIVIWLALSLLAHVALLLGMPQIKKPSTEEPVVPPLTAYLRQLPQVVMPPAALPPRAAPVLPQAPKVKTPAPAIARSKPEPPAFAVPTAEPAPPKPTPQLTTAPPPQADLSAYIAAQKRARGEPAEGTPSAAVESANRGALSSSALRQAPPIRFGDKPPPPSGGVFQIRRRGYDYAEFMFYGWNQNFGRAVPQLIEVRKGDNSDIDIAVIRKIIAIIRDYEHGDFTWNSKRSGKNMTLSARARDNSGLEEFMMHEFYEELHRYR